MTKEEMKIRNVLIYFAIKYRGEWNKIHQAVENKEKYDEKTINKELEKINCNVVTILDEDYPKQFRQIYNPPYVLFYYGDLDIINSERILGVVGSRNNSIYGELVTNKIINDLSEDIVIVSGLARGIDGIAHNCALYKNMKTIAVLGVGIDYCYPKENFKIYNKIKKEGLIISEYPYKETVSIHSFPFRNRLIAGLSDAIFIPECKERSGTLITVRFALEQGKSILVAPSSIFEDSYNNTLILEGASPVMSAKDIEEQIK